MGGGRRERRGSGGSEAEGGGEHNVRYGSDSEHDGSTLYKEGMCKVCFEVEVETVLGPCGHEIVCSKCAAKLDKCPVCRKVITRVIRVYV